MKCKELSHKKYHHTCKCGKRQFCPKCRTSYAPNCGCEGLDALVTKRNLTPLALDAAMPPSAEPDSGLESVPAVEFDTQPRK